MKPRRNLRVERWKRAVDIAKILFDDQGYHSRYLDDMLDFALGAVAEQDANTIPNYLREKTPKCRREPRCR